MSSFASSARMGLAYILCLTAMSATMSSVLAENNDEFYYNSLYRDGEGYNDKNVRNLDGIENPWETWFILANPQMTATKRQVDSIGGGSLLRKRSGENKMEENHGKAQFFQQNYREPKLFDEILEGIQIPDQNSVDEGRLVHGSVMMDSLKRLSNAVKRSKNIDGIYGKEEEKEEEEEVKGEEQQQIKLQPNQGLSKNYNDEYKLLKVIPVFDSFGQRDQFLLKVIPVSHNFPMKLMRKRQMDPIGGGTLLKRVYTEHHEDLKSDLKGLEPNREPGRHPYGLKPNGDLGKHSYGYGNLMRGGFIDGGATVGGYPLFKKREPGIFVQRRQLDSVGGGHLLRSL